MITCEVKGLEEWKAAILGRLVPVAKERIRQANSESADDLVEQVREAISHTTPPKEAEGHVPLEQTLRKEDHGEVGFRVSVGGPEAPYPLHLDAGHMARDGTHVEAQPFWYVSLRFLSRSRRNRRTAAHRAAVKATAEAAGTGSL